MTAFVAGERNLSIGREGRISERARAARPAMRTAICLLVLRGLRGDSRGAAAPCIHADDELLGGALRRHKVKVRHPKK